MTNEEMLLMALNGAQLPDGMTFQPQNNKQAYLAYACGLLTDASLLPPPRTREEYLLREYCLNGGGDDFEINDAAYLFHSNHRIDKADEYISRFKDITDMSNMCYGCGFSSFDLSSLDTSNVVSMFGAFYNCNNLTSLDVSNWDTSNVTTMSGMFRGCKKLTSLDVSNWDTSKVTNISTLFYDCNNLTSLDVSNWDTSNVENISSMFYNCKNLTSLDVSNWDTSKVTGTNMDSIFDGCNSLASTLDLSGWDTSGVTRMSNTFRGCTSLKGIIGLSVVGYYNSTMLTLPTGTSTAAAALKRLTFRTDLPADTYSVRGAIDIKYCSFERAGMVEMFNTLPDITGANVNSQYKKITITGNPCVKGGTGTIAGGTYEGTVAELADFITDNHLGETMCELNIDGQVMAVMGREIPSYFEGFAPEDIVTFNYPDVTYEIETLTDEDRAIATAKGWTLVG